MGLLQLISRKIGASDIAWGTASFSYVDENGISRTMQQVNAAIIPLAVVKDADGNVAIAGTLTASSLIGDVAITGSLSLDGALTLVNGVDILFAGGLGGYGFEASLGAYIWATNGVILFQTGIAGDTTQMTIRENGVVNITNLPAYVSNEAALAGGLVAGDLYKVMHDPVNNADPATVGVVY